MAPELPTAFGLKLSSNDKYLAYVTEDNEAKKLLKFYADDLKESTAVFGWEAAKSEGAGLVHLKSSYNNKYWQRQRPNPHDHSLWIAAEADEPVEDTKSRDCTLFEVTFSGSNASRIQLKHVETGYYIVAWPGNEPLDLCLYATGPNPGQNNGTFSVIEVEVSPSN